MPHSQSRLWCTGYEPLHCIVGEGEDTGLVPSDEALCRAGLVTVLPLAVDHLSAGVDLSGAVYTINF